MGKVSLWGQNGVTLLGLTKPQLEAAAWPTTHCPGLHGRRLLGLAPSLPENCQHPAHHKQRKLFGLLQYLALELLAWTKV